MTAEQKQTLKELGLHRADVMQGRLEALQAENAQLRAAIRRLCNMYEVDDYYIGQLREERLEAAVNRTIDAAMQGGQPWDYQKTNSST